MVIGQNGKTEDIELNVCKTKKLTNTRSSSETVELLEITPKSLRIRKKILDPTLRKRAAMNHK